MEQLKLMYSIVYGKSEYPPEDTNYRQLEEALGELMNIDGRLTTQTVEVALASVAVAIRNYQANHDWPSLIYMLFEETWDSIPKSARETILILTVPHLMAGERHPAFLWLIDEAIEIGMNALLHISFIEDAIKSDDDYIRAMAAYSLVQLPLSYWKEAGQNERRAKLIAKIKLDPSANVRAELDI